ncbi:MAG TPA: CsgG/HfaB family protein [Deltaproteobacteria bacterium]|nr:CsgG/HfaB family protein [Deltaproteobacteria bacterium]HQJ09417.1 CsgG/HfaB family protein [Deltaproteobacteria bacterium]
MQQGKSKGIPAAVPKSERPALAILKFINTSSQKGGERFRPWEYGIPAMLTTDLEQTSMFIMVERLRLNDILREHEMQQAGLTDPATALAVGKLATAKYVLSGTFMVTGQELRIHVQVFSVEGGTLLGEASAKGRVDRFFLVEKDAFVKVTRVLNIMLEEEKQARIVGAVETKSLEASLKNYSGETALIKVHELEKTGNRREIAELMKYAKQMFTEALEFDPGYDRAKINISRMINAIPMTL